ncbi:hypothetical protein Tco_1449607 [Tanacetum coccineum]
MNKEILQAREDLMEAIQAYLKEYDHIPPNEKCMALLLAEERFLKIKHAVEEEQNQPEVMQELLLKLMDDLQILKGIQPKQEKPEAQSFTPYGNFSMIDDVEVLMKDIYTFLRKFSRIPFGVTPKVILIAWERFADLDPKEDIHIIENLMYDNSFPRPPKTLKDDSETVIDSNSDYFSSDDNSYENIDYVDASPPDSEIVSLEVVEIVIPEVGGIDDDILLTIKDDILHKKLLNVNLLIANIEALKDNSILSSDFVTMSPSTSLKLFLKETNIFDNSLPLSETFCFNLEEISSGSTTTCSDLSLPDYEAFYLNDDHIKEKSSDSTTTHADFSQYDSFIFDLSINPFPPADRSDFYHEEFADELAHIISPPEYDCFYFKNEPKLGDFTMDVVDDFFDNSTREPRVYVPNILPTHPTLNLDLDFILSSDSLFAYIVWIFLPFPTYPVSPSYLLSTGNEDTIFDTGIPIYHSFMPSIYHQSRTFMKFNVYPNHLNESPMEILSSICFPMDNLIRGRDCPDFEDSRAHGFVHSYSRASYPQLHIGNSIS